MTASSPAFTLMATRRRPVWVGVGTQNMLPALSRVAPSGSSRAWKVTLGSLAITR